MTGTMFDYNPGWLDVTFSHDSFDHLRLDFKLNQHSVTTRPCDLEGNVGEPTTDDGDTVACAVYMSSVFCPFRDYIRFLEAVSLQVQECGFEWDAEGPTGALRWTRRLLRDETGFITVEWSSRRESFSHRTMVNTRQAVSTLYRRFRGFVESPDYDPIRWEMDLTLGEAAELVLSDAPVVWLVQAMADLEREKVWGVFDRIRGVAGIRWQGGPNVRFPLEYFLAAEPRQRPEGGEKYSSERVVYGEANTIEPEWAPPNWARMDRIARVALLKQHFDTTGWSSSFGPNLREVRSEMLERWLERPSVVPAHLH